MNHWIEYCCDKPVSQRIAIVAEVLPALYSKSREPETFFGGRVEHICYISPSFAHTILKDCEDTLLLRVEFTSFTRKFDVENPEYINIHREIVLITESNLLSLDLSDWYQLGLIHEGWHDEESHVGRVIDLVGSGLQLDEFVAIVDDHHRDEIAEFLEQNDFAIPDSLCSELVGLYEEVGNVIKSERFREADFREVHPHWNPRTLEVDEHEGVLRFTVHSWDKRILKGFASLSDFGGQRVTFDCLLSTSGGSTGMRMTARTFSLSVPGLSQDPAKEFQKLVESGWLDVQVHVE